MHPERVDCGRYYKTGFIFKGFSSAKNWTGDMNLKPFSFVTGQEARLDRSRLPERERETETERETGVHSWYEK